MGGPRAIVVIGGSGFCRIFNRGTGMISPVVNVTSARGSVTNRGITRLSFPSCTLSAILPGIVETNGQITVYSAIRRPGLNGRIVPTASVLSGTCRATRGMTGSSNVGCRHIVILRSTGFSGGTGALAVDKVDGGSNGRRIGTVVGTGSVCHTIITAAKIRDHLSHSNEGGFLPSSSTGRRVLIERLATKMVVTHRKLPTAFSRSDRGLVPC